MQTKAFKQLIITALILFGASLSFAQQIKPVVTGIVRSSSGEPLENAVVSAIVAGKTVANTITDSLGRFSFTTLPEGKVNFSFSTVGYISQTITGNSIHLGQTTSILVDMIPDEKSLNEVVVIGYGAVKKKEVTGAVASIKGGDINTTSNTNVLQALAGRVPGLTAMQTTGQPGAAVSVKIRDNPSFASSGVLYVIDGVPINNSSTDPANNPQYGDGGSNQSPLNFINPNDIESMEILKDASSAAIYGAQAGAGVVLITTKKGKEGLPKIEYGFNYAAQKVSRFYDVFDTKDYMEQRNSILYEIWLRNNKVAPYGNVNPDNVSAAFVPRYNQQQIDTTPNRPNAMRAITRNGFVQQHNLSISGISGKTQYFVSGNYLDQNGVIKGSDYKRYNARINLTQTISDKIKIGVSAVSSNSFTDNQSIGTGQNEAGGIMVAALYWPANLLLQNADGSYPANTDYTAIPNPLTYLNVTDKTAYKRLLGNAWGEWEITPGLKAKANFSYDQSTTKRSIYFPTTFLFGSRTGGNASVGETNATTKLLEYTLNYVKNINDDQRINAVVGYSYQFNNNDGLNAQNNSFVSDAYLYNNLGAGGPTPNVGTYRNSQTWASYFARAIYTLHDKYTLSASLRRDGSSIFAVNKKYGYFPSVAAGWVISDESFFKNIRPVVSSLKLRASYGTTGNSNIGQNALALYASGYNYVFNNTILTGIKLSQIANPNLTWETDKEINIGVDYSFLHNRISGSFDYFQKYINNLLTFIPLTTDFPVTPTQYAGNAGKTGSRGWEIGIHSKNIVSAKDNGFFWSTDLTLSHYYSYWIQRSPSALLTLPKYIDPKGQFDNIGNSNYTSQAIYGYLSDGIYRSSGTVPAAMPGLIPGGIIIKDLNGYDTNGNLTGKSDGAISSADRVYLGSTTPKLSFGFNNSFRYQNFDLSIYLYGNVGALKLNSDYLNSFGMQATMAQFGWNALSVVKDRWSYNNTNAAWPTGLNTGYEAYTNASDFWYEKADFVRCRDLTLGYQLPSSALKGQKVVSGLRLSIGVQNPFIITSYKGADPELQSYVAYPLTKSFNIGVNASF